MTAMATARTMWACGGSCAVTPATRSASRAPVAARARAGGHETRVARCGVRFERGRCRTGPGGDAVGCVRARASRAWTVVAGASESDDGDASGDSSSASLGEGVSTRVVPVPEPAPAQATPPRRRRGRPKGTRKVTNAPVPGDAMGVASLLWRLASDDEALNGTARIQPHGLEAVVPEPKTRACSSDDATADARRVSVNDARDDEDDDDFGSSDRTSETSSEAKPKIRKSETSVRNAVVSEEERRRRASRSAGVARSTTTRKKIAARQRERWAAARAEATAKRTADVARALAQKRTDAIAAAKKAALEGGAAAADAAARDAVAVETVGDGRSATPTSPWEALAANAGGARRLTDVSFFRGDGDEEGSVSESNANACSVATDAAERAAAFAALLSEARGETNADRVGDGVSSANGDVLPSAEQRGEKKDAASGAARRLSSGGGALGPGLSGLPLPLPPGSLGSVYQSFDASVDDEDDEELRATKRRMKEQLAKLTRRRAELMGATGAPSSVTVAKFTAELARYKRLRADLEEWSNAFSEKYARRPTLKDVERTGIAFLVENFKEYVELRDKLMGQTPHLRGQIEDVAKATLPTPRVVNKPSINSVNGFGSADLGGAQSVARRIAAAREGKYGAGVSAALGMEPAGPPAGLMNGNAMKSVVGARNKNAAEGLRGDAGNAFSSVARASALSDKSGSAGASANLAMKRAAAYRDANAGANAARRGRGRGRGRETK